MGYFKSKKGFTLVEIVVVIVIIAVLAAIIIPSLTGWTQRAKRAAVLVNAKAAYTAAQGVASENYGVGYASSGVTNYGIFANKNGGVNYNYTAVFSVDAAGNVKNNISSGKTMAELAGISDPYVCWVHFRVNEGKYIDAVLYVQDGYAAYYNVENAEWSVIENASNSVTQVNKPNFNSTATAIFGADITLP